MSSFGLSYGVSPNEPVGQIAEIAKAAEDIGYDCLWLTDTLNNKDIYVSLTLALLATTRIAVGPGVTSFLARHPAVTGNAMASLNEVGQGRLVMGLGAGGDPHSRVLGWKPSTVQELSDGIANLRRHWNDGRYVHDGRTAALPPAAMPPKILLAATKGKMLQLAGRMADGVILMGAGNIDLIKWQLDRVNEGLRQAGRSPDDFLKEFWITISFGEKSSEALDDARPWVAAQCRLFKNWTLPPSLERYRDQIERIVEEYDGAHHLSKKASHLKFVSDELADAVAIAGTARECAARLQEIKQLGFHRITPALRGGKSGRIAQMRTLMDEVLRHVIS